MITPAPLKKGDKVAIVATARKISKTEIEPAVNILKSWGLIVVLGENIFAEYNQFAGEDKARINDLQKAIDDNDIKAIICARGGYGTVRIIDHIDYSKLLASPKWICGYSDVTALHSHINERLEMKTLHSTMPINFENNSSEALNSLRNSLFGFSNEYVIEPYILNRVGECNGQVLGGNLSMIYSILGSKSSPITNGKILFIEDLDEYLYHIDRMMMNLKRNGVLENLVGLIVGGMTDMNDNTIPFGKNAIEIIKEHVSEYGFPVCFNFPAGHVNDNRTLVFGGMGTLEVTKSNVTFKQ